MKIWVTARLDGLPILHIVSESKDEEAVVGAINSQFNALKPQAVENGLCGTADTMVSFNRDGTKTELLVPVLTGMFRVVPMDSGEHLLGDRNTVRVVTRRDCRTRRSFMV